MAENLFQRWARGGYHPLLICEGTVEQVLITKLLDADALVFSRENVLDVTRTRRASAIQDSYLDYDFDWPVCIVRILDSKHESFRLGKLYADRIPVANVFTHPEAEVLAIIRENAWNRWNKVKSKKKPSLFCKDDLGMRGIKSEKFLQSYWDVDAIAAAAQEYRRLSKIEPGELCLADLIKEGL